MKAFLLARLIDVMLSFLTPEMMKQFADTVLDFIEDHVAGTETKVDDRVILPLAKMFRVTFGIPDNDYPNSEKSFRDNIPPES